ncbi:hypothetical protein OQA88_7721 [Cercophora sp. LCS_1]
MSLAKTIVATGASSGLGFEAIKQLLATTQPYTLLLGARDVPRTQKAYNNLSFDTAKHNLSVLPLELSSLKNTRSFAQQVLAKLGRTKIDVLLLNAAISDGSEKSGPNGSKWCESYVVNHLAQHYLVHLLREKLVRDGARIVVVSSGAVRQVEDPSVLDDHMKAGSGIPGIKLYGETKFIQLLGAHWWRRELAGQCEVLAVSPGLIPGTGIGRGMDVKLLASMPDAKSVPEGAASILRAFERDDFPEDPEQIFLTSWGEWWPKDVYGKTLDVNLQNKWCPSKEEIEREDD